jgi:hypothetical protein
MICIKVDIPKEICEIDDELKAIYHSNDSICIWVFTSRLDRNNFVDTTLSMTKSQGSKYYEFNYLAKL